MRCWIPLKLSDGAFRSVMVSLHWCSFFDPVEQSSHRPNNPHIFQQMSPLALFTSNLLFPAVLSVGIPICRLRMKVDWAAVKGRREVIRQKGALSRPTSSSVLLPSQKPLHTLTHTHKHTLFCPAEPKQRQVHYYQPPDTHIPANNLQPSSNVFRLS